MAKLSSAFKNSNGKYSTSGIFGSLCISIGLACYISGIVGIFKGIQGADSILIQSLAMVTLGSGMVITKKLKSSTGEYSEEPKM